MSDTAPPADAPEPLEEFTGHTPGPWCVEDIFGEGDREICLAYDIPGEGRPIMIASTFGDADGRGPITLKQILANARLMAAAPSLLEERDRHRDDAERARRERDEALAKVEELKTEMAVAERVGEARMSAALGERFRELTEGRTTLAPDWLYVAGRAAKERDEALARVATLATALREIAREEKNGPHMTIVVYGIDAQQVALAALAGADAGDKL